MKKKVDLLHEVPAGDDPRLYEEVKENGKHVGVVKKPSNSPVCPVCDQDSTTGAMGVVSDRYGKPTLCHVVSRTGIVDGGVAHVPDPNRFVMVDTCAMIFQKQEVIEAKRMRDEEMDVKLLDRHEERRQREKKIQAEKDEFDSEWTRSKRPTPKKKPPFRSGMPVSQGEIKDEVEEE